MKNTAVAEFLFVLATVAITGIIFIGCGGDTACEGDTCGNNPTTDGGTAGDNNPITGKDGGTPDGGDATVTSDAGSDAGKADCSKLEAAPSRCRLEGNQCDGAPDAEWSITVEAKDGTCVLTTTGYCGLDSLEGLDFPLKGAFKDPQGYDVFEELDLVGNQLVAKVTNRFGEGNYVCTPF